jgi:hypothetical protein
LSMLEKYVLKGGRDSSSVAEKKKALRRLLAIRTARIRLPEASLGSLCISATKKTNGLGISSPDGICQSFLPGTSGTICTIKVDISAIDNPNVRLEIWNETKGVIARQVQLGNLYIGENTLYLDAPLAVEKNVKYSFRLFPSQGFLALWTGDDSYAGGNACFIVNNRFIQTDNPPDLVFEIRGPNYVDLMDRFQERNEGSATYVGNRYLVLTGNSKYLQELHETYLDRVIQYAVYCSSSREGIMNTFFYGGWYGTGCTTIELIDDAYGSQSNYRSSFPSGGNPMKALETLCGPLSQNEMDALINDAKAAYNWQSILETAAAMKAAAGL